MASGPFLHAPHNELAESVSRRAGNHRTQARPVSPEERTQGFEAWARFDQAIGVRGFYVVLLTRLSPIFPFNLLNYFLGLTKIRFTHYLLASWIGMAPATLLYVYLGSIALSVADVLMGGGDTLGQNALIVVGLVATLVLVIVLARLASTTLKKEVGETVE